MTMMETATTGPTYDTEPEHGVERHRTDTPPPWTPQLRQQHIETSIRLSSARLRHGTNSAEPMLEIINKEGLEAEFSGAFKTLLSERGDVYVLNAIVWAHQDAIRHGVELSPDVMRIVQRQVRQNEMRQNQR